MSKEEKEKQMSWSEVFPANRSALPVNKKEEMTTDISGQKCLDSLKKLNQSSLLGKMCKALLTSKTAWYSDRCKMTWKVKVSKSNVSLFQLQASVLGTKGTESGLWATPNTMDHLPPRSPEGTKKLMEGHRKGRTKPSNLREQVDPETMKMYPTPNTYDYKTNPGEDYQNWKVRAEKKKEQGISLHFALRQAVQKEEEEIAKQKKMYPTPTAHEFQQKYETSQKRMEKYKKMGKATGGVRNLSQEVLNEEIAKQKRMYPTPKASGQENAETLIKRKGEKAAAQHNLTANVQMYPTPSASCQMDVVAPPETVEKNSSGWSVTRVGTGTKFGAKLNDVVNKVSQPIEPGGKLNPTFVEFLMGFPESWTNIEPTESKVSATPSSHKSQESSDSQSKKFYRTPTAMDKGDNSFKYAAKFLKGKTNRSKSKESVQKTLSMDVAMEHLKQNPELIELYDEKFKTRPHLPPKDIFLNYLKENLNKKELIAADIIKKTTIDHWLRSDHCFAYPTKEYWNMIKPYLKEVKFDYQMNFEIESDWE